jgi:hypothetical protein
MRRKSDLIKDVLGSIKRDVSCAINRELGSLRYGFKRDLCYAVGYLITDLGKAYAIDMGFYMGSSQSRDRRIILIKFIISFINLVYDGVKSIETEEENHLLKDREITQQIEAVLENFTDDLSVAVSNKSIFNANYPFHEEISYAIGSLILTTGHRYASRSLRGHSGGGRVEVEKSLMIYDFLIDILESLYNVVRLDEIGGSIKHIFKVM